MRSIVSNRAALAAVALTVLAACSTESVLEPESQALGSAETTLSSVADQERDGLRILVLEEAGAPSDDLIREIRRLGGTVDARTDAIGVLTLRGIDAAAAADLTERSDVAGLDLDARVQWIPPREQIIGEMIQGPSTLSDQSSAFFYGVGMQWNIAQIHADDAWLASGQGAGTTVAVLDTGIDPFHIDLAGKVAAGSRSMLTAGSSACGATDEQEIYDLNFHGTFVSGLITSNGLGLATVAPDASILAVKVLDCTGTGSFNDILNGLVYAADQGVAAINMSLGAYFPLSAPGGEQLARAIHRAVVYAQERGSLVVASAGNDGIQLDYDDDFIHVPSQIRGVVSVGATAPVAQMDFDMLTTYTNYGRSGVDLMAPGGDLVAGGVCGFAPTYRCDLVLSALSSFVAPSNNFFVLSGGTSFASPLVAAAGAVVHSTWAAPLRNRASFLERCILDGVDDLGPPEVDAHYGHGRLNVVGALGCVPWLPHLQSQDEGGQTAM